jgi:hypothetical protein
MNELTFVEVYGAKITISFEFQRFLPSKTAETSAILSQITNTPDKTKLF